MLPLVSSFKFVTLWNESVIQFCVEIEIMLYLVMKMILLIRIMNKENIFLLHIMAAVMRRRVHVMLLLFANWYTQLKQS
jgi:hypothetical protein